jgi:hypothetical protein
VRVVIISDTHDALEAVEKFRKIFDGLEADIIIHLGDYVSPFTMKALVALTDKLIGVFGNNDGDKVKLMSFKADIDDQPRTLEIDGMKAILFHGFKTKEMTREIIYSVAKSGSYDMVLYGHTHEPDLQIINDTVVVNPGSLAGYLAERRTYAVLDTEKSQVLIYDLDSGSIVSELRFPRKQ